MDRRERSVTSLLPDAIRGFLNPIEPAVERLLRIDRLRELFECATEASSGSPLQELMARLDIRCSVSPEDLSRIPATGPVLAVANHPFGFLEGLILASLLPRIRRDFKIVANSLLAGFPELRQHFIFVDPFGGQDTRAMNYRAVKQCLEWLRSGGLLVIFPAGEVAHVDWKHRAVVDPPWKIAAARLARTSGATTVPIYFDGSNSVSFQLLGTVHPRLRTISLPGELLNKRGKNVEVRIGRPVPARTLRSFRDAGEATEYLRYRTYLLEKRGVRGHWPAFRFHGRQPAAAPAAIISDQPAADVMRLRPTSLLCRSNEFSVYVASAADIPNLLQEIGRLREVTFRQAGEGTGARLDLDRFDAHYLHLFVWNHEKQELVGAYRLGATPDIMRRYGVSGLYTSTLFHYRRELFQRIGPAIELGRSFIRLEYQKQYAPLLLLWKGITRYVSLRPDCAVLFGGVSISNAYNPVSRNLMARHLETQKAADLAPLVKPRHAFRETNRGRWQTHALDRFLQDIDELADPIADLEAECKGVPVLVRQYLKLGGRVLGLNIDPGFSHTLDALIMVDLRLTPRPLLERYMSRDVAARFLAFHADRV